MERREFLIGAALAALLAACDRASDSGGSTAEAGELRSTIARAPGGGSTELAVHSVNDLGATLHRATATAQPGVEPRAGAGQPRHRPGHRPHRRGRRDGDGDGPRARGRRPGVPRPVDERARPGPGRPLGHPAGRLGHAADRGRAAARPSAVGPAGPALVAGAAGPAGRELRRGPPHHRLHGPPRRRPRDDQRLDADGHRRPGPGDPASGRHRPRDDAPPARRRPPARPVAHAVRLERHGRRRLHRCRRHADHRPDDALRHPAGVRRRDPAGRRSTCPTPATS